MLFKNPMTRTVKDILLEMPLQMQNIFLQVTIKLKLITYIFLDMA